MRTQGSFPFGCELRFGRIDVPNKGIATSERTMDRKREQHDHDGEASLSRATGGRGSEMLLEQKETQSMAGRDAEHGGIMRRSCD